MGSIWGLFFLFWIGLIVCIISIICIIVCKEKLGAVMTGLMSMITLMIAWLSMDIPSPEIYPLNNEIPKIRGVEIEIKSKDNLDIYYTIDGGDPKKGELYVSKIDLDNTATVAARTKFFLWWSEIVKSNYIIEKSADDKKAVETETVSNKNNSENIDKIDIQTGDKIENKIESTGEKETETEAVTESLEEDELKIFLDQLYEKISAEDFEGLFGSVEGITPISFETYYYQNGEIVPTIDSGYGMRASGYNVYLGEFRDSEPDGEGVMFYCAGVNGGRHRYYRVHKGTWNSGIREGYFEVYCSNGYVSGYEVTYSGNVINDYWNGKVTMNWTRVSDGFHDSGVIHAINGEFPVIRQEGKEYVYVVGESGMCWSVDDPDKLKYCDTNF